MNKFNIIFFIILIITFVHYIIGSVAFSFFTSNEIVDYNCSYNNKLDRNSCDNKYNSITGYINYAILKQNTKNIQSSTKVDITKDISNTYTSLLPLTVSAIVLLFFVIILLITYIFYKNIYIKSLVYIFLGLCLLFISIILIIVPVDIMDKVKTSDCSIQLMQNSDYTRHYDCVNTLNYAYLTNVITSFLIICIIFYLYYYGFKNL